MWLARRAWFRNYYADTKFEDYKKILHKYYKVVTVGKLFEYYKNVVPTNGKLTNLNHISSVDLTENSTTERSSV